MLRFGQTKKGDLLDCAGMKDGLQSTPSDSTTEQARDTQLFVYVLYKQPPTLITLAIFLNVKSYMIGPAFINVVVSLVQLFLTADSQHTLGSIRKALCYPKQSLAIIMP